MFKKPKNLKKEDEFMQRPETSDFSPTPTREPEHVKTVIGERITINGDIRGNENLVIEGSMQGKIELDKNQITVGAKGRVEAIIHAGNVIVSGRLSGNIKALGKVSITKGANFTGEIKARSISVEDGAYLKATIELEREPQKGTSPDAKPAPQGAKPVPSFEKKPVIPSADPIKKN